MISGFIRDCPRSFAFCRDCPSYLASVETVRDLLLSAETVRHIWLQSRLSAISCFLPRLSVISGFRRDCPRSLAFCRDSPSYLASVETVRDLLLSAETACMRDGFLRLCPPESAIQVSGCSILYGVEYYRGLQIRPAAQFHLHLLATLPHRDIPTVPSSGRLKYSRTSMARTPLEP